MLLFFLISVLILNLLVVFTGGHRRSILSKIGTAKKEWRPRGPFLTHWKGAEFNNIGIYYAV